MLSIDSETSGTDLRHGAKPFFVTTCDEQGEQQWWEWDVNPLTREPLIPAGDLDEIHSLVFGAGQLVGQNSKFDCTALAAVDCRFVQWPWDRTQDTLICAHVLASNRPHDLTSLALEYLGKNIEPYEETLHQVVLEARRKVQQARLRVKRGKAPPKPPKGRKGAKRGVQRHAEGKTLFDDLPDTSPPVQDESLAAWAIAEAGRPDMPSAKGKVWKYDTWLPRTLLTYWREHDPALYREHGGDSSPWWTVLAEYANTDSAVTLLLWQAQREELERRGLWEIYEARRKVMGIAFRMEERGVTLSEERLTSLQREYGEESASARRVCVNIAREEYGYDLELPKGSVNKSLSTFIFDKLKLQPIQNKKARTSNPTLAREALEYYLLTLPPRSMGHTFIRMLTDMRKRDTACNYMAGYREFWLPFRDGKGIEVPGWFVLHPHLNPTGTQTLRWSSAAPNEQNIAKQESFNLRYCFGPAPGREWWSLDAKNIELRIPAYESGEEAFIALFEQPDTPPYYGSNHLLIAHILFPREFEACVNDKGEVDGRIFKKKYASTLYQRTKNGNFACVPMDTEALTKEGWKKYDQISDGDLVLGYSEGRLRWTPVLGKVFYYNAELIELSNNHFKAVTTPDHRWFGARRRGQDGVRMLVDEIFRTRGVGEEHTIYLSRPVEDESELDLTDDEAAIIGFVYGDGNIEKSEKEWGPSRSRDGSKVGFRVKLFQSKPEGVRYVDELLRRWGRPFKRHDYEGKVSIWTLNPDDARSIWQRAGLWEVQDFEQLVLKMGPSQRKAFLEGVFAAEGTWDSRGNTRVYTQNEGPFMEGIRLAIYLTGRFPLEYQKKDYYGSGHTCLDVREGKPYVTGQRLKKKKLRGLHSVWCLQTGLGTWVMRQGRQIMLTGNCQYGAVDRDDGMGTADRTYGLPGAQARIKARFRKQEALNQKWISFAEKHGYVETMPSKAINPHKGYPILCSRTEYGRIKPTVPLNYHVQSTAMEWMQMAMTRCDEQLESWRHDEGFDGHMILQVHDELVFDFPKALTYRNAPGGKRIPVYGNLPRIRRIQQLMEQGGDDIGVPTPTSTEYHEHTWAEGVSL